MALTFNGSSSALVRTGSIVADYPFTLFAWIRATAAQTGFAVELAIDPGPRGTHEGHGMMQSSSRMLAWSTIGSGVAAYSSSVIANGAWLPCMVVFASDSVRKVYFSSGAVQTHTTKLNQNASLLNVLSIGKQAVKSSNFWAGDLACIGLWSSELSAQDFATLRTGVVPSTVQPASLLDYWSLQTQAATQTGLNGRVLAATNTAQAATHPIVETPDTTAPTMSGVITVSSLSSTGYTLSWPAGADDVAVTGYERSLDGGGSWVAVGNVLSTVISGRTPEATDQVRVRAKDGAGNASNELSTVVTLPADTTSPTMTGSLAVSAVTATSYSLAWVAATDNVAVTAYEVSVDAGTIYQGIGLALGANITGRTPGTTDAVRVRAKDAAGNASAPLSTSVTLLQGADTTLPVLTGVVTVTGLSSTGYTLSWGAGTDNVAVTSYERSLDGGTTWANVGNVLTVTITGRTPGSSDQVRVRARDAAGNVSTPALATTVNLPSGGAVTLSTPPLKNNTGTLLANLSGITVNVYNATSGVLVVQKTGLSSSAAGVVTFSDGALVAGSTYAYEVVTPANGRRLPTGTAA